MLDTTQPAQSPKNTARVLVIDDDPGIQRTVRGGLTSSGFVVERATTARAGKLRITEWHPDVVILDLSLPDADGLDVCREVRAWSQVPIIVLSVREEDRDKITALESGADDYLVKPFSAGELVARVRVALRHSAHATGVEARFASGDLVIDFERRAVIVRGEPVHLNPTEYAVLQYLAQHVGKVVTHHVLLRAVWGPDYEDEVHYLRVCIAQLRKRIERDRSQPELILTEPGVGYRLRDAG